MSISFQNNLKRKRQATGLKKKDRQQKVDNAKQLYQDKLNHMKLNQAFGLGRRFDKDLVKKKKDNKGLVQKFKDLFKKGKK